MQNRRKDHFWDKQEIGAELHWHNAFGKFVRGIVSEVTFEDGSTGIGLMPAALVGDWDTYELPKWSEAGVYFDGGSYYRMVRDSVPFNPNEDSIWESEWFTASNRNYGDPALKQEIDLTTPEPTASQARAKQFRDVLASISNIGRDPDVNVVDWAADYQKRILEIREIIAVATETLDFDEGFEAPSPVR